MLEMLANRNKFLLHSGSSSPQSYSGTKHLMSFDVEASKKKRIRVINAADGQVTCNRNLRLEFYRSSKWRRRSRQRRQSPFVWTRHAMRAVTCRWQRKEHAKWCNNSRRKIKPAITQHTIASQPRSIICARSSE